MASSLELFAVRLKKKLGTTEHIAKATEAPIFLKLIIVCCVEELRLRSLSMIALSTEFVSTNACTFRMRDSIILGWSRRRQIETSVWECVVSSNSFRKIHECAKRLFYRRP